MSETLGATCATSSARAQAARLLPYRPDDVWGVVSQFGRIAAWHPLITASELEDGTAREGGVGAVRLLHTVDLAVIREELVERDDGLRRLSYRFLESPFPVSEYLATIEVSARRGRPGGCQVNWTARFTPDDAADTERLRRTFSEDVFRTGLEALHWHLN